MERFTIDLVYAGEKMLFLVIPAERNEKIIYVINVDGHLITIVGNSSWDNGGPLLVPEYVPLPVDPALVATIVEKIEARFI